MSKMKPIVLSIMSAWALGSCASLTTSTAQPSLHVQPIAGVIQDSAHRPEALYQLGRYYQGQLRHKEAIDAYNRALARNPNLAEAHNAIGVIHASEGRHELAVQKFKEAIALNSNAVHFHNNLGYAYLLSNHEEDAVTALEEAQRLDTTNPRVVANMKLARERIGIESPMLAGVELRPIRDVGPVVAQPVKPEPEQQAEGTQFVQVESNIYELRQPEKPQIAVAAVKQAESLRVPRERAKLEVSNGNGVLGMAKKVARYLGGNGVIASRITNQKPFIQMATQIEYREGYELHAKSLNSKLPKPASLVEGEKLREGVDLRLVLGKDISRDVALFESDSSVQLLAQQ